MSDSEFATVSLKDGKLRGQRVTSKSGCVYYSFKGIPYAKPPVGPLRFKLCEPPEPWTGVRDAFKEGSMCAQYRLDTREYTGTEDCLYINVYTPKLPGNGCSPLPVMTWIHGGGYVMGAGDEVLYGPEFLLNEQVVVVSFNYRLGVLGFLCLHDPVAPGNIGLKDQVAALRWVQKNISNFGGDPNNVTIFGESAGAASVNCHMISPMSHGLFHKAMAQSGATFSPWAMEHNPREMAFSLGAVLGCNTTDPKQLVEFLRGVEYQKLVRAAGYERDKRRLMSFAFVSVVETEMEGVERFMPDHPLNLLEAGHIKSVPILTGVTSHEGIIELRWVDFNDAETTKRLDRDFEMMLLPELRLPEDYQKKSDIAAKFREFYFKGKPICKETLPEYIDMYSDIHFGESVDTTVKKIAKYGKAPVFYYQFSFDGKLASFKTEMKLVFPGVCHGDDVAHIFRVTVVDPDLDPNSTEELTRKRMVKMWTNFAKTGNPTPKVDALLPTKWEPHTATIPYFMDIGEDLKMKKGLHEERMKFFETMYRTA